jgi:hypothetical protein
VVREIAVGDEEQGCVDGQAERNERQDSWAPSQQDHEEDLDPREETVTTIVQGTGFP